MKVISLDELKPMGRVVNCPRGDFISNRFLLRSDGMGFSLTKTVIAPGRRSYWHYKRHLEACYCVAGSATLTNAATGEKYKIVPDVVYALDNNDPHYFEALVETVLICVFNPPLAGNEVHMSDGSYVEAAK